MDTIKERCWGCISDEPNQLAHMDIGGCLYEEYGNEIVIIDYASDTENIDGSQTP